MARKTLKSFKKAKKKDFIKTAFAMIDDNYGIPLKSLTPLEALNFAIDNQIIKPPVKERKATDEEKKEFLNEGNKGGSMLAKNLKTTYLDYADEDYLVELQQNNGLQLLLDKVKYVDMNYKIGTTPFWEDIGVKDENDYIGVVNFFFNKGGLEIPEEFYNKFDITIKGLKGDNISQKVADMQSIVGDQEAVEIIMDYSRLKEIEIKAQEKKILKLEKKDVAKIKEVVVDNGKEE